MSDILEAPPETLDEIPREPTQDGPRVRLYLVDGSGFIFRAFHALPPLTRKTDGLP
ncbi:MAG: polA, partial [Phenylobacterium sp.]|nr:polA [Phenylobacterium sp.]